MAAPHAPIIALRQSNNAVSAFLTTEEAVDHLREHSGKHGFDEGVADVEFFDARGRRLNPTIGSDGRLQDLAVASDENHAEHVRERVRSRAEHARHVLEQERDSFERVDESPLTLADEDIAFEVFAWRLASVLRPEPTPHDPVPKDPFTPQDVQGWWHNTFSH